MLTTLLNESSLRMFGLPASVPPIPLHANGKVELGQYMTPSSVARFMASLFPVNAQAKDFHLVDAGAGKGALTLAFLEAWRTGAHLFQNGEVSLFEYDEAMLSELKMNMNRAQLGLKLNTKIYHQNFIEVASLLVKQGNRIFSHAILNPPYKKINNNSLHRQQLREAGIETINLYSGFVALSLALLKPHGQLVAIIPRSFCNGPYYRKFRKYLMSNAALHHIHLFKSRCKTFKDDDVLQENIILRLERDGIQGKVRVSQSTDSTFEDYSMTEHQFSSIFHQDSNECFLHIPTESGIGFLPKAVNSLSSLKINVSTGPIVDFRLKEYLHAMPENGDVPLLYPKHFNGNINWPQKDFKKPNAIFVCSSTMKLLYPNGWYVVVRRLSSKEEKRRIVANIVNPNLFNNMNFLGFENHLNVFHKNKEGISENLARGLACYLNSKNIDTIFRSFNGHTQVNSTDLRSLLYPSAELLSIIGEWSKKHPSLSQENIDKQMEYLLQ